jgi:diguanylate cyclase (GGDEF)-like protein/PAS domain S-box-containing protein
MSDQPIRILLVEDNEADARFVQVILESSTAFLFEMLHVDRLTRAIEILSEREFDVVLLDLSLPDEQGIDSFLRLYKAHDDIPIVIMSGLADEELAMEAVNIGAQDYLVKGTVEANLLTRSIRYAIERMRIKAMLLQAAREWSTTFNALEDAIILTDSEGKILRCNEASRDLFGKPLQQIIGRLLWDYLPLYADSIKKCFNDSRKTVRRENIILEAEGKWFSMNLDPIFNEKNFFVGSACIFSDITRQKRVEEDLLLAHEELKKLAATDQLTGAFTRLKFEELMKVEIERAKRYGYPLSLIMFDIDNFKIVNDTHGHIVGDQVLKAIAGSIRAYIRNVDFFVRWGGEEFMIISSESSLDNAYALAERLRQSIENRNFQSVGKVTVSFGVTEFKRSDDEGTFIKRADEALYLAKSKGKNRVEAVS